MLRVMSWVASVRWHRAGFRRYWRCESQNLGGRPQISADLRALIRRMSVENVLWGAPRIHGELLKLGFAVAESTVTKYMTGHFTRAASAAAIRDAKQCWHHKDLPCHSSAAPRRPV
jgi:hypothetical protein